jgi:ABC-type multidrug transport system ATPase subunit
VAVELQGVDLDTRGGRLLQGADAHLRPNLVHGVAGHGGSGKSALIALIAGLLPPTAGRVTVLGLPQPDGRRQLRGRIAALFQEEGPYPRALTRDYLRWFGELFAIPRDMLDDLALGLLRRLHIEHLWSRRIDHLHPGGVRLVATVRCLLPSCPLTVLDEPFAALDPLARDRLSDLLRTVAGDGRTVIITSNCTASLARTASAAWLVAAGTLTPVAVERPALEAALAAGGLP